MKPCIYIVLIVLIVCPSQRANGQVRPGAINGRVLDATDSTPLGGASVFVEALPRGLVAGTPLATPFLRASRSAVTDGSGRYEFNSLSPGAYRLYVRRFGYRPQRVFIDLSGSTMLLSVGLDVIPVRLEPIESQEAPSEPFGRVGKLEKEPQWDRVKLEEYRQAAYLAGDSRGVTRDDVRESGSLGESDLFRTLRSMPGVSFRDELSAELRTRGARWDHTRVTLDGLPLFNPVHLYGVFSSINTDILGSAFFHPGVRPSSLGEGAAGVLELKTRSGNDDAVDGVGELSLFSGRLAFDGTMFNGSSRWVFAGRRSYADLLMDAVGADLNYALSDMAGRVDQRIGANGVLSLSGMHSEDSFLGTPEPPLISRRFSWKNNMGRASYAHAIGVSELETSVGFSGFWGLQRSPRRGVPTSSAIDYLQVRGELRPVGIGLSDSFSVGYEITRQRVDYAGEAPSFSPIRLPAESVQFQSSLSQLGAWLQKRHSFSSRVLLEAGLRVETGGNVARSADLRLSPGLVARFLLPETRTTVSAGFGRSFQYTQAVGHAGEGPAYQQLNPIYVWMLAGDSVPALVSDIWTVTAERWFDGGALVSLSVYSRETDGVGVADPTPGPVDGVQRLLFGSTNSRGIEVSMRKLTGRMTGSVAYALSQSRTRIGAFEFASDNDRTHLLSLVGSLGVTNDLTLGTTFNLASGVPFTRYSSDWRVCDANSGCTDELPVREAPNSERAGAFMSVNLLLDWTHSYRTWDFGVYFRLVNLLDRENAVLYRGPNNFRGPTVDGFEDGIPAFPVLGLRVAF